MWGLESPSRTSRSRSRLLWQSLGLISKFEPGLGLGVYGLDYITARDGTGQDFCSPARLEVTRNSLDRTVHAKPQNIFQAGPARDP